jgi:hypothetical protein
MEEEMTLGFLRKEDAARNQERLLKTPGSAAFALRKAKSRAPQGDSLGQWGSGMLRSSSAEYQDQRFFTEGLLAKYLDRPAVIEEVLRTVRL